MADSLTVVRLRELHDLECLAAERRAAGDDEHAAWLEQDAEDLETRMEGTS